MARHIRLIFPTTGIEVIATLLDKDAPLTCDALWQALAQPVQTTVVPAQDTEAEIFCTGPALPALGDENVTSFPAPGDLLLYHLAAPPSSARSSCHIVVHHARGPQGQQHGAGTGGRLFATITQNLAGLQQVARQVAAQGPQPLRIERTPPCPLPWLRDGIIQVGLVVEDLDPLVERWWQLFGIGPWRIYSYGRPLLKYLSYRGTPVSSTFRIALAWIGPLCIELIEPGEGEQLYKDFVRRHGYGLHHLAVSVEDMEEAIAQARAHGLAVTQEGGGHGLDGSGHFAYLDTEGAVGCELELVQYPKVRVPPQRVYPPQG